MSQAERPNTPWRAWARTGLPLAALLGAVVVVPIVRERRADRTPATSAASSVTAAAASPSPAPSATTPGEGAIDVASLLEELVDLARLARRADPPYTAHLAASYDVRSKDPRETQGWFANDDWASQERPNYVRIEERAGRREYVLLDAKGPGAIVRFWSAGPSGTLRVYVDGAEEPALASSMRELLSGTGAFPRALAYVAARGFNAYFPLPFAKSCKVTVDDIVTTDPFRRGARLEKFYYQLNYRLYDPAVAPRVRSFTRNSIDAAAAQIARVSEIFERPTSVYAPSAERSLLPLRPTPSGAELTVDAKGGGAIRELVLRVRDTSEAALRRARLVIAFDGARTVRLPLGDFFGGGPGIAPYVSLPLEVHADGKLISRWVMPFAERLEIEVKDAPGVDGEVSLEPHAWGPASQHFHANFASGSRVKTRPYSDLTLLHANANGLYVGTAFAIDNGKNARWWGEGDEKIYVDGASFPTQFGTGTEDYFGFAWSTTELFSRALHAQTRAEGPGFHGRAAMNRFHLLDAVPFTKSLKFDMELWHWDDTEISWESVAYWYGL